MRHLVIEVKERGDSVRKTSKHLQYIHSFSLGGGGGGGRGRLMQMWIFVCWMCEWELFTNKFATPPPDPQKIVITLMTIYTDTACLALYKGNNIYLLAALN